VPCSALYLHSSEKRSQNTWSSLGGAGFFTSVFLSDGLGLFALGFLAPTAGADFFLVAPDKATTDAAASSADWIPVVPSST
jgi:hypothetical protein